MNNADDTTRLQRAMAAIAKLRDRVAELQTAANEPIAVISMACRFPGDVESPEDLWRLLREGREALGPFPDRPGWDADALYDPDPDAPGKTYTKVGHFLRDVAGFDAGLFRISRREADRMDPQQRFLLETSWEAFERARIPPRALARSVTGVYVGVWVGGYGANLDGGAANLDGYAALGTLPCVASGRISYSLGLQGPALSIDTACSSSLVALHLAMQALRRGECSLALAGGVTVMSTPMPLVEFSRQRGVAPDGRCKAFSDLADGPGWGEGCGLLLLERLSDARRNGRKILGLLVGSAINQDGQTHTLSAPNGPAQERVIRAALASAGLDAREVDAVEAHGTGTTLGDPIEAGAVLATYGQARRPEEALYLGSIKSNMGHTQAAAGAAGVMKVLLALQHGLLPRSLHLDKPTRQVDWGSGAVRLLKDAVPWPRAEDRVRRAGVSSFGVSGTNAHLIVQEAPLDDPSEQPVSAPGPTVRLSSVPLVVYGQSEPALRANAARLGAHLGGADAPELVDVGWSLVSTRSPQRERLVLEAADAAGAAKALLEFGAGGPPSGMVRASERASRVVFLYPGQGSQYPGMCRGLLDDPVFAAALKECDGPLGAHAGFSATELLRADEATQQAKLQDFAVVQPLLFAVRVALTRLWAAFGIKPSAVLGHSQGEIVAAVTAGALSLEQGARIVAFRSRLMKKVPASGGMATIGLSVGEVEELLAEVGGDLHVAAVNASESTLVGGARAPLEALVSRLLARGVFCRRFEAPFASHTPQVEPILDELRSGLAGLSPREGSVPFHSSVHGRPIPGTALGAEYWAVNLRRPVRFDLALASVPQPERCVLLEVSAHPLLVAPLTIGGHGPVVGTLRRELDPVAAIRMAAASLHAHGASVDVEALFRGTGARTVDLPPSAFDRHSHWLPIPPRKKAQLADLGLDKAEHPLLDARVELPGGGLLFVGRLETREHGWMDAHRVFGTVLLPGAAMLELASHAAAQCGLEGVRDLVLTAPLALDPDQPRRVQLAVGPTDADGLRSVALRSRTEADEGDGHWTEHFSGTLGAVDRAPPAAASWPPAAQPLPLGGLYERLEQVGVEYGPSLRGLAKAWHSGDEVYAEAALPEPLAQEAGHFGLHPALLDTAMHSLLVGAKAGALALPFEWRDVQLHQRGAAAVRARFIRRGELDLQLELFDPSGAPVASVGLLRTRRATAEQVRRELGSRDSLFSLSEAPLRPSQRSGGAGRGFALIDASVEPSALPSKLPALLLVRWSPGDGSLPSIHETTRRALAWLKAMHADTRFGQSRVAWVTRNAVPLPGAAAADPAAAVLWGLGRTAQAEAPDRDLVLADLREEVGEAELGELLEAAPPDERQLLVRKLGVAAPRLVPAAVLPALDAPRHRFREQGTVVVTGGTGGLGAVVARHLVTQHGVKNLLLLSRSGRAAPGATELISELERGGASAVDVVGCDVADPVELHTAVKAIPKGRPLCAIFHLAATLDDALLPDQTAERAHQVMRPKVDAALHLHELTKDLDLDAFVLFSSIAGMLGTPAQGPYAAASCVLDALAAHRRAQGLPALSLAWGEWTEVGKVVQLDAVHRRRLHRSGAIPIDAAAGMALLDKALAGNEAVLAPVQIDRSALSRAAAEHPEGFPSLLKALVRKERPRAHLAAAGAAESLAKRLSAMPPTERFPLVLERVRSELAAVLGLPGSEAVPADRSVHELGMDSLMAVETRNRLTAALGIRVPVKLLFEHPVPRELTSELLARMKLDDAGAGGPGPVERNAHPEAPGRVLCFDRRPGARLRLLVLVGTGSRAAYLRGLAVALPEDLETWIVEYPGRGTRMREQAPTSMDELVGRLTLELGAWVKEGPFAVLGHSLGALVAFELTLALARVHGERAVHFFPAGMVAPSSERPSPFHEKVDLQTCTDEELVRAIKNRVVPEGRPDELVREFLLDLEHTASLRSYMQLYEAYAGSRELLECPITVLTGTEEEPFILDRQATWKEHTRSALRLELVPGAHDFVRTAEGAVAGVVANALEAWNPP